MGHLLNNRLLLLFTCLLFIGTVNADQLKWLSKENAERAAKYIQKQNKVFLFCGCCEEEHYKKIRPSKVTVQPTGTEGYYEVVVSYYPPENGVPISQTVDLAYIWVKKKRKWYTVGQILRLQHDPCKQPQK